MRSDLNLICHAEYSPQNETYDLTAEWTISNPLAAEVITTYAVRLSHKRTPGGFSLPLSGTSRDIQVRDKVYSGPHSLY